MAVVWDGRGAGARRGTGGGDDLFVATKFERCPHNFVMLVDIVFAICLFSCADEGRAVGISNLSWDYVNGEEEKPYVLRD